MPATIPIPASLKAPLAAPGAPVTTPAAFLKREAETLQACTYRGVVVAMMTDSINDVESVDMRYGSWHGGMQRNMDAIFQVDRIQTLLGQMEAAIGVPSPAGMEDYKLRQLSFENRLSKLTADVANTYGMMPAGARGTFAAQHGTGMQATYESTGKVRSVRAWVTAFATYVATNIVGTKYHVVVDGITIETVTATSAELTWRKHELIGMPAGWHTMEMVVDAKTVIFNSIDSYVGSERAGVRIYNMGQSGQSLNEYSKTLPSGDIDQKWAEIFPLLADDGKSGCDIGVMTLSTNNQGDSEQAMGVMFYEFAVRWFEKNPNSLLRLTIPAQPNSQTASSDDWPSKHRAARRVAALLPWVIVDSMWAGDVPGRIPRMENDPALIKGLHPKTPVLLGDNRSVGYAKTLTQMMTTNVNQGGGGTGGGTGGETGGGGGTGGGTADTTPPAITLVDGATARTVPEGGSTKFRADVVDATSKIGIVTVRSTTGKVLGNLIKTTTTGNRYEFEASYSLLRQNMAAGETSIRCFIRAYDEPGNWSTSGAFDVNVPLPTTVKVAPTISNVTATGFDVPGSKITITADLAHSTGISLAPLNINGAYAANLGAVAGSTTKWSGTFDRVLFPTTTGTYAVGAAAKDSAAPAAFQSPQAYTLAGTKDSSGPTGRLVSPLTGTTLSELVTLEATAVDADSGVLGVRFYVEVGTAKVLIADGDYTSASLFRAVVPSQGILDVGGPRKGRICAELEDRANNITQTEWAYYTIEEPETGVAPYDPATGLFLALFDGKTKLPAEKGVLDALRAALSTASGDGGTGGPLLRDPDSGKLYDPSR